MARGGINNSGDVSPAALSAAEAVVSVLETMKRHAPQGPRDGRKRFQENLARLANTCRADLAPESWRDLCKEVEKEAALFAAGLSGHQHDSDARSRQLMASLCAAAEALAPSQAAQQTRFRGMARKLRNLAARGNTAILAARLERDLLALERSASQQPASAGEAVSRLHAASAQEASTPHSGRPVETLDPASGLPDRFEADASYQRRSSAGERFSLALGHLECFASFADRQGLPAAAQLQRHFARRMLVSKPTAMELFAWEPGAVLVIAPGPPDLWLETCAAWEDALSGIYHLRDAGRHVQFAAQCRLWIEEANPPEPLGQAVARAVQSKLQRIPRST